MRQLDAETARGIEDRLTLADLDLVIVDQEGVGLLRVRVTHRANLLVTNVPAASSVHPENILAHKAADWAPPGRGRRSRRRASAWTIRQEGRDPTARWP